MLGDSRGFPRPPRDRALRAPPIREAESTIGVLRNALGMCKREAGRSESAIGVTKTVAPQAAVGIVREGRSESTIGVLRNALGMCKREAGRSESAIGVTKTAGRSLSGCDQAGRGVY